MAKAKDTKKETKEKDKKVKGKETKKNTKTTTKDKEVKDKATKNKKAKDEVVKDEPVKEVTNEPVKDEVTKDEIIPDEVTNEEIKDKEVTNEPVKDEEIINEKVKDLTIINEETKDKETKDLVIKDKETKDMSKANKNKLDKEIKLQLKEKYIQMASDFADYIIGLNGIITRGRTNANITLWYGKDCLAEIKKRSSSIQVGLMNAIPDPDTSFTTEDGVFVRRVPDSHKWKLNTIFTIIDKNQFPTVAKYIEEVLGRPLKKNRARRRVATEGLQKAE